MSENKEENCKEQNGPSTEAPSVEVPSTEVPLSAAPLAAAVEEARMASANEPPKARMVKLKSSDDEIIEVEFEVIKMSSTIKEMIEALGDDGQVTDLSNVPAEILRKVVEFCQHHKDDAATPPPPSFLETGEMPEKRTDDISEWDRNFVKAGQPEPTDHTQLFKLLLAANLLQVKPLKDVCCKTIANMIKGHSVEEVRRTFNIHNV